MVGVEGRGGGHNFPFAHQFAVTNDESSIHIVSIYKSAVTPVVLKYAACGVDVKCSPLA